MRPSLQLDVCEHVDTVFLRRFYILIVVIEHGGPRLGSAGILLLS
jgi:hypothetical protein